MKISLFRNIWLLALLLVLSLASRASAADWAASFGGSGANAYTQATATDTSGNTYLAGHFTGATLTLGSVSLTRIGSKDAFVAKLDASGTVLWAKNFGGSGAYASNQGVAVDGNGNIYLWGSFSSNNLTTPAVTKVGAQDAFAIKLDASGTTIWAKNFGGSGASAFGYGIAVDGSSNIYLAGFLQGADLTNPALTKLGSQDAFAIKLDASGTTIWAKSFGGNGASTLCQSIAVDGNGSVYLGGYFSNANLSTPALTKIGTHDAFALKLDANGATTWAKNFGGSLASAYGMGITVDASGNIYLGGFFQSANLTTPVLTKIGIDDAFAFKLDSTGTTTWARNFGGSGAWTRGFGIAVDGSSNIYLGGWFQGANLTTPALTKIGSQDAFAFRLDSTGATSWTKNFGGSGATAYGQGIVVDGSGAVYLGGSFSDASLTTPALTKIGATDAFIIYSQFTYGRTVTATAGANGTIVSTNPLTVNADATASFTVSPNATYQPSTTVSGDCPSGSWNGYVYTTGAITADCTVGFSFTRTTYPLTLSATGTGDVTATAAGYGDQSCSDSCGYSYDIDTVVTLTPNPGTGFSFTGWTGDCTGTGACQVTMDSANNVTANFVATSLPELLYSALPGQSDLTGNDVGEVILTQYDGNGFQVYSNIRGQLSAPQTYNYSPAINNLGDVVWTESGSGIKGIISGQTVTLALSNGNSPGINDRGEVVWIQWDSYSGTNQIISNVRGQLVSTANGIDRPAINNRGDVVWSQWDNTGFQQIYTLAAGSSTPVALTNDLTDHWHPAINDSGEIVWAQDVTGIRRILSSVRGQLSFSQIDPRRLKLNNCGDVLLTDWDYSASTEKLYRLGSGSACVSHPGANNSPAQASPAAFGNVLTGLIDAATNPVDWYRFDATAGGTIHITVNYDTRPPNALTIGLYDDQANLLSGPTATSPLGIHATAGFTGTYYLKVESTSGRFGYAVSLSKYTNNCGVGPCPEIIANGNINGGSINSLGEVVWSQYDQTSGKYQIFSSIRGQLTYDATDHASPAINSLGDLVWVENYYALRGIITGRLVTLMVGLDWDSKIDINDRGEVVWDQNNQLYSNVRGRLTSGPGYYYSPSINNQGDVVFTQYDPEASGPEQVYKLSIGNTSPVAVTNDSFRHLNPAINDGGEIVWIEYIPETTPMRPVSSIRGILVVEDSGYDTIDLNDSGDIIYVANEFGPGMKKLYRLGNNAPCASFPVPNDSQGQASAVTFGDIFTGLVDSTANPVDWYRFDAAAGDRIHITINYDNSPPNDLTIGLYDGLGNLLSGPTSTTPLGIHTQSAFSGTYYLKAESSSGHFGYAVSLSKYTNNCGVGPCPEIIASGNISGGKINSLGEVVWAQFDESTGRNQIFSSTRGQLTSDAINHNSPAINNLGDLVWTESFWDEQQLITTYSIKGIIGGHPVVIWTGENWLGTVDINDQGEVVWNQNDNGTTSQIFSNLRGQITSDSINHYSPNLNNQGDVVFTQYAPMATNPEQVYKVSTGNATPVMITNDSLRHLSPAINDIGEIVWIEYTPETNMPFQLVSSIRGTILASFFDPVDLNNCGDLVYVTGDGAVLYRLGNSAPCVNPSFYLTVLKDSASTGTGQVTSNPAGLSLGSSDNSAMAAFPAGSLVTLTATPDATSLFAGWSGACSGTGACQVTMDMAKMVTAAFDLKPADTTPPVTTASPAGGTYTAPQTVTLACSDDGGSGCAATNYCLGAGCTPTLPYSGAITVAATTDLRFASVDNANNSEAVRTESYLIDIVLPTASVSGIPASPSTASGATLTVGGTDVVAYRYKLDEGGYSAELTVATPIVLTGLGDGSHTVSVLGRDSAGNWQVVPTTASWTVDLPVSTPGGGGYAGIQAAYNALLSNNVLQLKATAIIENLIFNRNILITLRGGYDPLSGTTSGMTTLHGSLEIGSGTVVVENLIITTQN